MFKGVTRPIRQALKKYDPNIVESRAEEIIKGVEGRGGRGPEVKSGQDEVDYSKRKKEEIDPLGYQATKMDNHQIKLMLNKEQLFNYHQRK